MARHERERLWGGVAAILLALIAFACSVPPPTYERRAACPADAAERIEAALREDAASWTAPRRSEKNLVLYLQAPLGTAVAAVELTRDPALVSVRVCQIGKSPGEDVRTAWKARVDELCARLDSACPEIGEWETEDTMVPRSYTWQCVVWLALVLGVVIAILLQTRSDRRRRAGLPRPAATFLLLASALLFADARPLAAEGLSDDGRAGVVADLQGTAMVRPAGRSRWGLVAQRTALRPGDVLRTLARGANAVEVRLADGGSVVLGPGAEATIAGGAAVRVHSGEAEVAGTATAPVLVTGPGNFTAKVAAATTFRAADQTTTALPEAPRWISGYRGSTTDEWMGSLLAQVDGRDVPLAVGYHKVDATIRDRIAETVIEESFVNTTDRVLEGTFTFPLPAGASVSGFGMWIGEEYVEADVVERTRARRIYEEIRSRKKDPGLLEWSGGNLFQASVFPIPARGEKRVRLRYTETLPREGTTVRYRYALRSEMLRAHPLRELRIRVSAESAQTILTAGSATHEVRTTQTDRAVTFEHAASDVRPERDFEVWYRTAAAPPLQVLPHRRGDDGYFLLAFTPPDPSATEDAREVLPDGAPLDLLFACDTSGSMDAAERDAIRRFVEAALALLGPEDRFRLMAFDAQVAWMGDAPLPATPANAARALAFLDARRSLGWTDMDRALAAAAAQASHGTLVVFLGDGVGTAGDPDPVALAKRLAAAPAPSGATFHAVAPGSSWEQSVLDAIVAHGGGTVRSTGNDAAAAAFALLDESARPALRDVRVEFEGLRTAAVYPERIPVVAAGREQVVLGRFLPAGDGPQKARATLSGMFAGKPVRWTSEIEVAAGESGNSFLPRLWARRHLDALLAAGSTPGARDEIVAFSERFGIVTPHTSLLVLESDEDRERYGVRRRVHMRDGERFFAESRDRAAVEAARSELRRAGAWQTGVRRRLLAEIEGLGRNRLPAGGIALGELADALGRSDDESAAEFEREDGAPEDRDVGIEQPGFSAPAAAEESSEDAELTSMLPEEDEREDRAGEEVNLDPTGEWTVAEENPQFGLAREGVPSFGGGWDDEFDERGTPGFGGARFAEIRGGAALAGRRWAHTWAASRLLGEFPELAPPVIASDAPPANEWDAEIARLLSAAARAPGPPTAPVEARIAEGRTDAAGPGIWPWTTVSLLVASDRWLLRERALESEPREHWADSERGVLLAGRRLGRRRAAGDADRSAWSVVAGVDPIDFPRNYAKWTARIESRDAATVTIRLDERGRDQRAEFVTLDTEKEVVTALRTVVRGKPESSVTWSGFVRAGGLWWPAVTTWADGAGRETKRRTIAVREVPVPEFDAAYRAAASSRDDAILLGAEEVSLPKARQAAEAGRAGFAEHFAIACWYAGSSRWDDCWRSWQAARALVPGRPGVAWIEAPLLDMSRRGEEWSRHVRGLAEKLAEDRGPAAFALARGLAGSLGEFSETERDEMRRLLERAGTPAATDDETRWQARRWREVRAEALTSAHRFDEAVALRRALLDERPGHPDATIELADAFRGAGDADAAVALLRSAKLDEPSWTPDHVRNFASSVAGTAWNAARHDLVLEVADRWLLHAKSDEMAHQVRLAALDALGRYVEYEAWIAARLEAETGPSEEPASLAEFRAAVDEALSDGWRSGWSSAPLDPRRARPLAALARRLSPAEGAVGALADRILDDWRFRQSPALVRIMPLLRADLLRPGAVESGSAERLAARLRRLEWGKDAVDDGTARDVVTRVVARLRRAEDPAERESLFETAVRTLDARGDKDGALALLRDELRVATSDRAAGVATSLLERLLDLPWSPEVEDEAWALVPRTVPVDAHAEARRATLANATQFVVAAFAASRRDALLGPVSALEKLPRAEIAARRRAVASEVRRALTARLAAWLPGASADHRPWVQIERLCLDAELGEDPRSVEGEARELLASPAARGTGPDDALARTLRSRAVLVLSYVATRRNAPEGLADRVATLFRERLAAEPESLDWRWAIFRLLVALDRADELARTLGAWIGPGEVDGRWRTALAYVLAGRGKFAEAILQLETAARLDVLDPAGFDLLARWYLAVGDDGNRARTLERRWERTGQDWLQQRVWDEIEALRSAGPDGVPRAMDPDVLLVVRTALRSASDPADHLSSVGEIYALTKDVRLLDDLADGVVGHTQESVYFFVESARELLAKVHEEATCDGLRARAEERLRSAKTDTDRRGLTLLLVQIESRAAEVTDQPGPHAARALAALRSAPKGAWQPDERTNYASFLGALGEIRDPALDEERTAQLRDLHRTAQPGSEEQLQLADELYSVVHGSGNVEDAVEGLAAALEERRAASGGVLPSDADRIAGTYVTWLERAGRFADAEAWLTEAAAREPRRPRREAYERRLFRTWVAALEAGGETGTGAGGTLFRTAQTRIEHALASHLPERLPETFGTLLDLFGAAQEHLTAEDGGGAEAAAAIVRFSRAGWPLLSRRLRGDESEFAQLAERIARVAGPAPAVAFVVDRLDTAEAPRSMRGRRADLWERIDDPIARWRRAAGALGAVEARLLAATLAELERELLSDAKPTRRIYRKDFDAHFWKERAADFAAHARRVAESDPDDPALTLRAATYLFQGLDLRADAVAMLESADERGALDFDGRSQLVEWHQGHQRWAESLPHVEKLLASRPGSVAFRIAHFRALHGVGRDEDARAAAVAAAARIAELREAEFTGDDSSNLAEACLDCGFPDLALAAFEEAIAEVRACRGGLAEWGVSLRTGVARAQSALGHVDEAVDAASAALVGAQDEGDRKEAFDALHDVIAAIPDLAAWEARWEETARTSGSDAPVVRRALARVHAERDERGESIRHLLVARRLTPEDAAVHADLIAAYEKAGDDAGLCDALAEAVARLPSDSSNYRPLAGVLRRLGRADDAERALTGLAEHAPQDGESHGRLAAAFRDAERFDEAVLQHRLAVRMRPFDRNVWCELASTLLLAGRAQEAGAALDEYLRTSPGDEDREAVEEFRESHVK